MTGIGPQLELARRHLTAGLERFETGSLPRDLRHITSQLNLTIRMARVGSGPPHGQIHRMGQGIYEVVLADRGNPFESPQLRFTLAHEIAHCLIDQVASFSPGSTSEYWQFEELCNDFAARLLIPDRAIDDLRMGTVSDSGAGTTMLNLIERTARVAKVSREVAGRRIGLELRKRPYPSLVAAMSIGTSRRKTEVSPVVIIDWSGGWDSRFAPRRHISLSTALGSLLYGVLTGGAGTAPHDVVSALGNGLVTVRQFGPSQVGVHINDALPSALLGEQPAQRADAGGL